MKSQWFLGFSYFDVLLLLFYGPLTLCSMVYLFSRKKRRAALKTGFLDTRCSCTSKIGCSAFVGGIWQDRNRHAVLDLELQQDKQKKFDWKRLCPRRPQYAPAYMRSSTISFSKRNICPRVAVLEEGCRCGNQGFNNGETEKRPLIVYGALNNQIPLLPGSSSV